MKARFWPPTADSGCRCRVECYAFACSAIARLSLDEAAVERSVSSSRYADPHGQLPASEQRLRDCISTVLRASRPMTRRFKSSEPRSSAERQPVVDAPQPRARSRGPTASDSSGFASKLPAASSTRPHVLAFGQTREFIEKAAVLQPAEAEAALLPLLQWRGERNVFAGRQHFGESGSPIGSRNSPHGPKSLEEWKRFWRSAETDSLEGRRPLSRRQPPRPTADLDQLTPDDFRLRPDSAGYRAGKDGKDLGADVDLVGPGPAYERWKKTPEYQQWLKETRQ